MWQGYSRQSGAVVMGHEVLVYVVNPQSFHWTMDLNVPGGRLLGVSLVGVASGTVTAWLAGRAAAGRNAAKAAKEDWSLAAA